MRARTRPTASLLAALLATPPADEIARAGLSNMRRLSLLLALCLAWSFALSSVALAATPQSRTSGAPGPALVRPFTTAQIRQTLDVIENGRQRQALVQQEMLEHAGPSFARPAHFRPLPTSVTLLDDVGRLARPVSAAQVRGWREVLQGTKPAASAPTLLLWLGEYRLAHDEQPEAARHEFRLAQRVAHAGAVRAGASTQDRSALRRLYGLAAYDNALALYGEGAYADAAAALRVLITRRTALPGYDRGLASLWYRDAASCTAYHARRAQLGIPEPPRLDPLCGAAALAASLRAMGRPYDRGTVVRAVRPTGEGSSLKGLLAAAPRLGTTACAVTADDRGLELLPKPLVAFVEHDHFVSVTRAGRRGVSYLCSDCGPWPGGEVDLTWRQWHMLQPTVYALVGRPGGAPAALISALRPSRAPATRLASAGPLSRLHLTVRAAFPALLRGHVVLFGTTGGPTCGFKRDTAQCTDFTCCPLDGDPVNLATGEEEYAPPADLTVYNPAGPSVSWGRIYGSQRSQNYNDEDFGMGWSQTYNLTVSDPALAVSDRVPQGGGGTFPATNQDYPHEGGQYGPTPWDIVSPSGAVLATSDAPGGWSVSEATNQQRLGPPIAAITVTAPSAAAQGTGYEVRSLMGGGPQGAFFSVVPAAAGGGPGCQSAAGTKYVVFANGSRVAFTAGSVPSASTPVVACATTAGAPYLVSWCYDGPYTYGHFVVTGADRTQWVFSLPSAATGAVSLTRIVDRNGNAITLNYLAEPLNGTYASRRNLLTGISDAAGNALLTVNRGYTGATYQILSVLDRYGRGVYYTESSFQGSAEGYNYNLATVSQVVAAGTSSPPLRYTYGYTGLDNDESYANPYLNTITVPSPTGSGVSTTTINYDPSTYFVSSQVDGNGNTRAYTATDASGAPTGNPTDYTTVTVTGAGNVSQSFTVGFDTNMSETSRTDGAGTAVETKQFSDPNDPYRPSQVTDGNGHTTSYTWDQYGNPLTETPPSSAQRTPAGTTSTYSYPVDSNGNLISTGELTRTQVGGKTPTTYAYYEPSGLVQTVTGPRPGTSGAAPILLASYAYDGLGNVTSTTRPGPNSTGGNVGTYVTTAMNYTNDGSYSQADAIGQPLTVTDPLGHATHLRYDARGNTTATVDAAGNETDFTFNLDDRPLSTVYPATGQSGSGRGSTLSTYLYNGPGPGQQYGPLTSVQTFDEGNTAGAFRTVSYSYDQAGQTTGVSGGTEPVTYAYDALYRLTGLTDGGGHTTHYFYRPEGYLLQVAYPGSGATTGPLAAGTPDTVSYTWYDHAGNLRTRVDGNNTLTTYTYADPESRLTGVHYSPGSGVASLADTTYQYDQYGRRATMADGTGGQSYTYADDDALTADTTTYAGLPARTVSYAFDPDGSRQSMGTPAGTFSYGYDNAGRETSLTNPAGQSFAWAYLNNDWLQSQSLPGGVTTTDAYDARGQVTDRLTARYGSGMTEFGAVRYDGAGDRTGVYCAVPGTAYDGAAASQYDAKSQLTGEQRSSSAGYALSHAYDGAGNPTTFRSSAVGAANADNQLPGVPYDGDGAPTTCKGTSVTYDPEGRAVNFYGLVASAYTGDGLRGAKYAGGLTYFLYDGEQPVCELNSSGAVTAVHTFGPDGLLARGFGANGASGTFFYTWDLSGNLARRLDGSGNVLASAMSDGFGEVSSTDNSPDPFSGFGGQWGGYTDAAQAGQTGLTLLTHRFYDPSTGRFLTRDPLGYNGGINLYAYTQNDPVNENDPDGTQGNGTLAPPISAPTGNPVRVGGPSGGGGSGWLPPGWLWPVIVFTRGSPADPTNEWGPGHNFLCPEPEFTCEELKDQGYFGSPAQALNSDPRTKGKGFNDPSPSYELTSGEAGDHTMWKNRKGETASVICKPCKDDPGKIMCKVIKVNRR